MMEKETLRERLVVWLVAYDGGYVPGGTRQGARLSGNVEYYRGSADEILEIIRKHRIEEVKIPEKSQPIDDLDIPF